MLHENYVPLIDSLTQLMIIAQTFKISVAHTGINIDLAKLNFHFQWG